MPYHPLQIPPGTPPGIEKVVRERIDPQLCDVHSMLRLPIDGEPGGLEGGCTFSAALTLFEIVGGVSQELYRDPCQKKGRGPSYKNTGVRFKKVLEDHFPWPQEPKTGEEIVEQDAAKCLYFAYRNPLSHNLGHGDHPDYMGGMKIVKEPLPDREIEDIERATVRPPEWTIPTLRLIRDEEGGEIRKLKLKCFYWGVRWMIEDVLRTHCSVVQQPLDVAYAQISATASTRLSSVGSEAYVPSGSTDHD